MCIEQNAAEDKKPVSAEQTTGEKTATAGEMVSRVDQPRVATSMGIRNRADGSDGGTVEVDNASAWENISR